MGNQLDILDEQVANREHTEFDDVVGLTTIDDDGCTPLREQRAAAEARIAGNMPEHPVSLLWLDPSDIAEWEHVASKGAELEAFELDRQIELMAAHGQTRPVIVRPVKGQSGRFEAIGNAWIIAVAAELGRRHGNVVKVEVEVRDLTDEQAFAIVGQELETGPTVSSYDRGLFYAAAVVRFGSETAAAVACRTTKSSVSKNLDVVRAVEVLGNKIEVRRAVGQRDAMWLMSIVGRTGDGLDVEDGAIRNTLLATIDQLKLGPAKKVFATLRAALRVGKPHRGETVLTHGDREIGRIRSKKGGPVRIDLGDVGDLELDIVVDLIREALAASRRSTSF